MKEEPYLFFGNAELSIATLDALEKAAYLPNLIVTKAGKPSGRGMKVEESEILAWANSRSIAVLAPEKLDTETIDQIKSYGFKFALLASYGKIIPQSLLDTFPLGILNIHPSLLPLYRGPSPIESALLEDVPETGVTLMKLDSEMDHGEILGQTKLAITDKDNQKTLYAKLGSLGVKLFIENIDSYLSADKAGLSGSLPLSIQNHALATYCTKFEKSHAEIKRDMSEREKFSIARTFTINPIAFMVVKDAEGKDFRIKITDSSFDGGKWTIKKVIPEGKKEMNFADFQRGWRGETLS